MLVNKINVFAPYRQWKSQFWIGKTWLNKLRLVESATIPALELGSSESALPPEAGFLENISSAGAGLERRALLDPSRLELAIFLLQGSCRFDLSVRIRESTLAELLLVPMSPFIRFRIPIAAYL